MNGVGLTGGANVGEILDKGLQGTVGNDLRDVSSDFGVGLAHESTHPQKIQDSHGQKQSCLDSAISGSKQPKVHTKLKRIHNPRDVAMFLGFYSNAKEVVTQRRCDLASD